MPRVTVNVNLPKIQGNRKNGTTDPVVRFAKGSQSVQYGKTVNILHGGEVVAQLVYRPSTPLSCGATCWLEVLECADAQVAD